MQTEFRAKGRRATETESARAQRNRSARLHGGLRFSTMERRACQAKGVPTRGQLAAESFPMNQLSAQLEYEQAPVTAADLWHPNFVDMAYQYSLLGMPEQRIAALMGVSLKIFRAWCKEFPALSEAVRLGGMGADAQVATALFQNAVGYEYQEDVIRYNKDEGSFETITVNRFKPGDTKAQTFWLKNRQGHRWKDRVENSFVDDDGKPMAPPSLVIAGVSSGKSNDDED